MARSKDGYTLVGDVDTFLSNSGPLRNDKKYLFLISLRGFHYLYGYYLNGDIELNFQDMYYKRYSKKQVLMIYYKEVV